MPRSPHSLRRRGVLASDGGCRATSRAASCRASSTRRCSSFDAEAASIALFEQDPDRLEFRVAAGAQGAGAVGLTVPPTQGIAGFVYSTGQALSLSDVADDPRFNRDAAEQTGYVPRSIAAAPLLDEDGTIGVLQVLDKRGSPDLLAARHGAARRLRRRRPPLRSGPRGCSETPIASSAACSVRSAPTSRRSRSRRWSPPPRRTSTRTTRLPSGAWSTRSRASASLTDRETALLADILDVVAVHASRARRPRAGR